MMTRGNELNLKPTEELSFGGGHLFAYDYIYDKRSITTDKDINAVFNLETPGKEKVQMNLWMKGEKGREIFAAKSPKSTAIDRIGLPKEISELPLPTLIARQTGEAWTKPFAAVFEPSSSSQPKSIQTINSFTPVNASADFTGLIIEGKEGGKQFVYSLSETGKEVIYKDQSFIGTYAVISENKSGLQYLFLGNGKKISKDGYSIAATTNASAALEMKNKQWFYTASAPVTITLPAGLFSGKTSYRISVNNRIYTGKKQMRNNKAIISFNVPAAVYTKIEIK